MCVWGRRAGVKFAPAKLLPNSPLGDLGAILGTHSEDWSLLSLEKFQNIPTFFANTCVRVCACVCVRMHGRGGSLLGCGWVW